LEAVEYLLKAGYAPQRTIILGFGHDEEIGGKHGASAIASLLQERGVRLEAVIDEGLAIIENFSSLFPKPCAMIGVAEKGYMTVLLSVHTTGGHSSTPPKETAISILSAAIGKLSRQPMPARLTEIVKELFRRIAPHQKGFIRFLLNNHQLFGPVLLGKFENSPAMNAMVRTTFAPTIFQAGIKDNILPTSASAAVNIRILPGDDIDSVMKYLKRVVDDPRIDIQVQSEFFTNPSPISSTSTPSFKLLEKTILDIFPETIVAPGLVLGGTDCRYYQPLTSNAFRFMPIVVHPQDMGRVHGANERINTEDYCQSVVFYQKLIQNWSS
jgi:carboxypeptidase PM20D1